MVSFVGADMTQELPGKRIKWTRSALGIEASKHGKKIYVVRIFSFVLKRGDKLSLEHFRELNIT